jgi:hypothetical protein
MSYWLARAARIYGQAKIWVVIQEIRGIEDVFSQWFPQINELFELRKVEINLEVLYIARGVYSRPSN